MENFKKFCKKFCNGMLNNWSFVMAIAWLLLALACITFDFGDAYFIVAFVCCMICICADNIEQKIDKLHKK